MQSCLAAYQRLNAFINIKDVNILAIHGRQSPELGFPIMSRFKYALALQFVKTMKGDICAPRTAIMSPKRIRMHILKLHTCKSKTSRKHYTTNTNYFLAPKSVSQSYFHDCLILFQIIEPIQCIHVRVQRVSSIEGRLILFAKKKIILSQQGSFQRNSRNRISLAFHFIHQPETWPIKPRSCCTKNTFQRQDICLPIYILHQATPRKLPNNPCSTLFTHPRQTFNFIISTNKRSLSDAFVRIRGFCNSDKPLQAYQLIMQSFWHIVIIILD